jgi:hypothetical protein
LIVPVGELPLVVADTLAVNVTGWPTATTEPLDWTDVWVEADVIAMLTTFEMLELKLASPLYVAVIECCPGAGNREPLGKMACPPMLRVGKKVVETGFPSIINATFPVGMPFPD